MIEPLGLEQSAGIRARLADGKEVTLESYTCILDRFGTQRTVKVISSNCQTPLLGIGLFIRHRLVVEHKDLIVGLE
jgi:hypothetical protein